MTKHTIEQPDHALGIACCIIAILIAIASVDSGKRNAESAYRHTHTSQTH